MKLTFPHIGNTYIVAKALLDDLGADYVVPPFNSPKTLEIGSKYTQEMHCMPYKIFFGNLMQAYEMGAEALLITGGCGPCKLGYFGEMLKKSVKEQGIKMDVFTIEMPSQGLMELAKRIKKYSGTMNPITLTSAVKNTKDVAIAVDRFERLVRQKRCRELVKGSVDALYREFHYEALNVFGSRNIMSFLRYKEKLLNKIEVDNTITPLRVGIVGEIYTSIEPFANMQLEQKLGNMGIDVERKVTVSQWIVDSMLKQGLFHFSDKESYISASKPYIGRMIGGHAQHTVGNSVLHAKEGYDGIVHIYPLGCMPEIVSQSILPAIENDFDIPIMTVIRDEMTAEAGFDTRIEAFVDLLKKRRRIKDNEQQKRILLGY